MTVDNPFKKDDVVYNPTVRRRSVRRTWSEITHHGTPSSSPSTGSHKKTQQPPIIKRRRTTHQHHYSNEQVDLEISTIPSHRQFLPRHTTHKVKKTSKRSKRSSYRTMNLDKQRQLHDLDLLEQSIRNETHTEWQQLLDKMSAKHEKRIHIHRVQYELAKKEIMCTMEATRKMAYDQFHVGTALLDLSADLVGAKSDKAAYQRSMTVDTTNKIHQLQQEYGHIHRTNESAPIVVTDFSDPFQSSLFS